MIHLRNVEFLASLASASMAGVVYPGPDWGHLGSTTQAWGVTAGDFGGTFPPVATATTNLTQTNIGFNGTAVLVVTGMQGFNTAVSQGQWNLFYTGPAAHVEVTATTSFQNSTTNNAVQFKQDGVPVFSSPGQGGPIFMALTNGVQVFDINLVAGANSNISLFIQGGANGPGASSTGSCAYDFKFKNIA